MTDQTTDITPQVGDLWEIRMPGQKPRVREIISVFLQMGGCFPNQHHVLYAMLTSPNGHHESVRVRKLQRFAKRLSTLVERQDSAGCKPGSPRLKAD